jgi:hypothetical protein
MDDLINQAIISNCWTSGRRRLNKNRYSIIDDTVIVQLTQGKYCIMDLDNINILDEHIWRYTTYARSSSGLLMHKVIIGDDDLIYHINGNVLDNRKSNLITRTQSLLQRNRRVVYSMINCNNCGLLI